MATAKADPTREPLLKRLPQPIAVPPMLLQPGVDQLTHSAQVPASPTIPTASWVTAHPSAEKTHKLPQCIAHRGYKAKYPENTMAAFKNAVKVGAHAIETDLHITKDDVVVISHDATLKRCFGRPEKIIDCNWDDIKDLRTLKEPHEPLPRLADLLAYLSEPAQRDIWIFLDIKLTNDPNEIMRLIAKTLSSMSPSSGQKPWSERIVLGLWAAKYLPPALDHLPGFPIMHIGFSLPYARHFFSVPGVGFNMLIPILLAPGGKKFIRDARAEGRKMLAWTVNDVDKMEWCIRRGLDGVMTDEPERYLQVCKSFDPATPEPTVPIAWGSVWTVIRIYLWVYIMGWTWTRKMGPVASRELITRKAE